MLLAAKPATASARRVSDGSLYLRFGFEIEQMGRKAGSLENLDKRWRRSVGPPADGDAPGRQVDAGAFHAGQIAQRLFDGSNTSAAVNSRRRQIGLAYPVSKHHPAGEQHLLAGSARVRQQFRQFRFPNSNSSSESTPGGSRQYSSASRTKTEAASPGRRASFRVRARGE